MQEQLIQCVSKKYSSGGLNSQQWLRSGNISPASSQTPWSFLLSFAIVSKGTASEAQPHLQRSNAFVAFVKYVAVTFWSWVQEHQANSQHNSKGCAIPDMYLVSLLQAKSSCNYLTLKQAQWQHDAFCRQCRYTELRSSNDIKCLLFWAMT